MELSNSLEIPRVRVKDLASSRGSVSWEAFKNFSPFLSLAVFALITN